MQCIRCRRELPDIAVFCPDCGLKIDNSKAVEAGADTVPSGLPGLPVLSPEPSIKNQEKSEFVPASFDQVTPSVKSAQEPYSYPEENRLRTAPGMQPAFSAAYPQRGYASAVFQAPVYPIDESDYYHIDATESYNFEAFRGISIVTSVISALTMVGILFPLPLCVVTLVFSCLGVAEKDPARAKSRFNVCRILTIISIIAVILLIILIYVLRYLHNYAKFFDL